MRPGLLCSVAAAAALCFAPQTAPAVAQAAAANPPAARGFVPPGAPLSFADIVERVAPAVVSIDVARPGQARTRLPQLPFPFPLPQRPGGPQPEAPEQRASGSGFFISADGYIVTNNHVVENATRVTVRLQDDRELAARVVGRDPLTDLAVLKVDGDRFPFVSFATEAQPRVGDWVLAVGNPFNLGGTATAGVISAYGRDIGEAYVDYLQIDAPINRGNSGGPTFDVYGRVIGVNTAIFSPSGGSVGIGFAIPANVASRITRQLIQDGRITRGYLGATIQNLTPEIADSLGISGRKGALVAELAPGGPAERAGLRPGDAVLALNGQPLASSSDLTRRVGLSRPGERLQLDVHRDGRTIRIEATSGTRPAEGQLDSPAAAPGQAGSLGLTLRPLDPATRAQQRIPAGRGVVVEAVEAGSDAARRGLRAGDVILRVGDRDVSSPADVAAEVAEAGQTNRNVVLLLVSRDGRNLFLAVRLRPEP